MTPDRFRGGLNALGWSGRGLAAQLRVDERQVRRWASGSYAVPSSVAEWLERLARFHEENPSPARNDAAGQREAAE